MLASGPCYLFFGFFSFVLFSFCLFFFLSLTLVGFFPYPSTRVKTMATEERRLLAARENIFGVI